jgi:hypothetical protein
MNPCYLKDRRYHTNTHTVQEFQAEIVAVTEEITGDMLLNTVDNFVVPLHVSHEVEGCHIEHMVTGRPHPH